MKELDLSSFEKKLGFSFKDKALLKQALTHRSYINEHPKSGLEHNERLEFLGDAVLELAATRYLYEKFSEKPEGELTSLRAALVNTRTISEAARSLGANDYLLLSRGEAKDTGRARQYILANTFEALIGALYLDQGYDVAKAFIGKTLFPRLEVIMSERLWRDSKSHFQEKAQEIEGVTPFYKVFEEVGPDHDKRFTTGVYLGEELISTGKGKSKQEAEQETAKNALEAKGWG